MFFNAQCRKIVILVVLLLFLLPSLLLAASPAAVKWADLENHLGRQSVAMESLPVVDCPAAVDSSSAEHLVCQVIENTFYKWKEYEFFNAAGETRIAIEMIKPEARRLTAAEALVLLNGSKLCERQMRMSSANFTERQPDENPLLTRDPVSFVALPASSSGFGVELPVDSAAVPEWGDEIPGVALRQELSPVTGIRESIHGSDDRIRVASHFAITDYPFNTICYLHFKVAGEDYRGSGVLIAPYTVLTCGHNIWDQDLQVWSDDIKVTPAQHQASAGAMVIEPYGTVANTASACNTVYTEQNGGFEYDYGAVKMGRSFAGISTFMPIEYDYRPTVVNIAGYPAAVQNESNSYDMWYCNDDGKVIGFEGVNDRIMLYNSDSSAGQSGSPVWYYDGASANRRLLAIHVFGANRGNGACRLVGSMEKIISGWMQYRPEAYDNFSYIPYLSSTGSRWTGVALANYNDAVNNIKIEYFNANGTPGGSEFKSLSAYGQTAFAAVTEVGQGWIRISSSEPLTGLALIGDSEPAAMFDIDLKTSLHRKFICSHLAADNEWRSFTMVCNPADNEARVSFTYYDTNGDKMTPITIPPIPAHGSVNYSLYSLFRRELKGGSLVIESDQLITAFLLYDNKNTTWKAGLSAVPID